MTMSPTDVSKTTDILNGSGLSLTHIYCWIALHLLQALSESMATGTAAPTLGRWAAKLLGRWGFRPMHLEINEGPVEMDRHLSRLVAKALRGERKELQKREVARLRREALQAERQAKFMLHP